MDLRAAKVAAPLFRLVEKWLRAEFDKRQAEKKERRTAEVDPNNSNEILGRERTQFTGFSRGSVIPTPNFNQLGAVETKEKTQAQIDREEWAKKNNAHATEVSEGAFTQFPSRLGFNKSNPLPK